MGQSRPLFVYFRSFLTISIQIEKSIDGVLGIWTRDHRMVGADETMELWWPPNDDIDVWRSFLMNFHPCFNLNESSERFGNVHGAGWVVTVTPLNLMIPVWLWLRCLCQITSTYRLEFKNILLILPRYT